MKNQLKYHLDMQLTNTFIKKNTSMKKICLLVVLLTGSLFSFAQSLDEINDMMGKAEYKKAKDGIDKFLKDPKNANSSDGWYFRGRVYNSYSKDTSLAVPDAIQYKLDAFNAFKKVQQLDKNDIRLKLESYLSYFDLYNGFFDIGARGFNGHDYNSAFNGFKNALEVEDYVRAKGYEANGFKFPALDTTLVYNITIVARQAKKEDEAIPYCKMLVDAKVNTPNYLEVYEFLVDYYLKKKDMAAYTEMLGKSKQMYPNDPYWESVDIDQMLDGLVKDERYKKYDELMVKYPNSFLTAYNYSIELYKFIYSDEAKTINVAPYKAKFEEAIKKAIAIKSTPEANFLMANYFYNNSFDLGDESKKIKGVKPEDVKKRNELANASKKCMDDCIPFAETAVGLYEKMPKLKSVDKTNFRQTCDMLSEIYRVKGDVKKSAEYKAKKDSI